MKARTHKYRPLITLKMACEIFEKHGGRPSRSRSKNDAPFFPRKPHSFDDKMAVNWALSEGRKALMKLGRKILVIGPPVVDVLSLDNPDHFQGVSAKRAAIIYRRMAEDFFDFVKSS